MCSAVTAPTCVAKVLESNLSGHSADVSEGSSEHDLDVLTFTMFTPRAVPLETHVITAAEYLET